MAEAPPPLPARAPAGPRPPAPTPAAAQAANPTPGLAAIPDPSTVGSRPVPVNGDTATVGVSVGADTAAIRKYAAAVDGLRDTADAAKAPLLNISIKAGNFPSALALTKAVAPTADGSSASIADAAYKSVQGVQATLQNTAQAIGTAAGLLDAAEQHAAAAAAAQ